ncbi:mycofactocin precursor MftA [Amycolatopsis sp. NPDC088138]
MTEKTLPATESAETTEASVETPVAEDLLVEEVSIDGMCGVY